MEAHLAWEPDAVVVVALDLADEEATCALDGEPARAAQSLRSAAALLVSDAEDVSAPIDTLAAFDVRLEEPGRVVGKDDLRASCQSRCLTGQRAAHAPLS